MQTKTKYVVYFTDDYETDGNYVYDSLSGDDAHKVARLLNKETTRGITVLKVSLGGYETAMGYTTGETDTPRDRVGIYKMWTFEPKPKKMVLHKYGARIPQ